MNKQTYDIQLKGCAPTPLAHYLKALGILRLVAEQVDSETLGWWQHDTFWLRSSLSAEELASFFLTQYSPTPLVGPWGARSGFFPSNSESSARAALYAITESDQDRLSNFQSAIRAVRKILSDLGLDEKADTDEDKLRLLRACRANLNDQLLSWLDAVYVLLDEGRAFPPLLGTGGNEGSGSYMSGFAQQIVASLIERAWDSALPATLFGLTSAKTHDKQTPGHFFPDAAGGPNATQGFEGAVGLNPWDYILALEGSLVFASSAVKRLESHQGGKLAYPFCVKPSGVGYDSGDLSDEGSTRAEMWLPIWSSPATLPELQGLFGEGRATLNRRPVRTGVDFARSVAQLGVDRGISEFQRYAFQQRNGLSNFAIPLAKFSVRANPGVEELLGPIDQWLDRFRRAATGKTAPARAGRSLRRLESAIMKLCQSGQPEAVQSTLVALGEAEASVAISKHLRDGSMGSGMSPLPKLDGQWLLKAYDGSCEFRLAASLASVTHTTLGPIRRHLEPIDWRARFPKWLDNVDDPSIVWRSGSLIDNLCCVLSRRLIESQTSTCDEGKQEKFAPLWGRLCASLTDVAAFIRGTVSDEKIDALFRALCLAEFAISTNNGSPFVTHVAELARTESISTENVALFKLLLRYLPFDTEERSLFEQAMRHLRENSITPQPLPDAIYSLLKLCFLPHKLFDATIVIMPQIIRQALAGNAAEATQLAARRLRGSGFAPAVDRATCSPSQIRRIAAAILFPIHRVDAEKLAQRVLTQSNVSQVDDAVHADA